jgi:hypothetical protein
MKKMGKKSGKLEENSYLIDNAFLLYGRFGRVCWKIFDGEL